LVSGKIKNLLFWLALPLLLPQALYVRKTATRSPPAGGPSEGRNGAGEPIKLLAIGDSIVAGVGASELSKALVGRTAAALAELLQQAVAWKALGVSGYNSTRVLQLLVPQLPDNNVDYVIVSVGVNDITGLTTLRRWRDNMSTLLDRLASHSPNATIAVAGMPPMHSFPLLPQPLRATFGLRAKAFDAALLEVIDRHPNAVHIPLDFEPEPEEFAPDGYHPSEASYIEFGHQVAAKLIAANAETRH
jgi:lysophospholipase L1-like esterase